MREELKGIALEAKIPFELYELDWINTLIGLALFCDGAMINFSFLEVTLFSLIKYSA